MQLRGDITYEAMVFGGQKELVRDSVADLPHTEEWLCRDDTNYSPDNARELEVIRAHCVEYPQGILLDIYQAITALGLKHPSGTIEAQRRYLNGLRSETAELHSELMQAQYEHPYGRIADAAEEFEDLWLLGALNTNRLRSPHLSPERRQHYLSELGDVLWYIARTSEEMRTPLSSAVLEFLLSVNAGKLQTYLAHGQMEDFRARFAQTMDFDLFQAVALNVGEAMFDQTHIDNPVTSKITVDDMPAQLFGRICEDGLWPERGVVDDWDPTNPYEHLPQLRVALGKLTWFVAYTAHSLLNADFRTVMQLNLKKMVIRTRNGTLFEKDTRDE